MIMRPLSVLSAAAILSLSIMAPAQAKSVSDKDFVHEASVANEFEIESSKLALEKSQNKQVKRFAQHMIDDHTKTADKLKNVLQSYEPRLQPDQELDSEHQKMFDELQAVSGDDFNHKYINMQTDAHKSAVKLFSDYANHGKESSLRDFAKKTLPALKDHLKEVEDLKM